MNKNEALNIVEEAIKDAENTDDIIIKTIHGLKLALFNLKIEDGRILEDTGIQPIADSIQKNIDRIENLIKNEKVNDKKTVNEAFAVLHKEGE